MVTVAPLYSEVCKVDAEGDESLTSRHNLIPRVLFNGCRDYILNTLELIRFAKNEDTEFQRETTLYGQRTTHTSAI